MQSLLHKGTRTCLPVDEAISVQNARITFESWLREHPNTAANSAGLVAAMSLVYAHKCVTSNEPQPSSGSGHNTAKSPASDAAASLGIKDITIFAGQCRLQIVSGFFPCEEKVIFTQLRNGRSVLTFVRDKTVLQVSGGRDRQPNLENYYLSIDTFALKIPDREEAVDRGMEGECHFRLNKDATKFFFVKCDIYNRQKGSKYNLYLENIRKTDHKAF
jgi:hypothetical protein